VPVIKQLLDDKHEVIIAGDGRVLDFLKSYFPNLKIIILPGYHVVYPGNNKMIMKMALQLPGILLNILKEHRSLKKIVRDHNIDIVISDNRFGLWTREAFSVYITHQLMIKAPDSMLWAEPLLYRFHRWFVKQYDECWIPDLSCENNLSGDLAHKYPLPPNGSYIGILSRFSKFNSTRIDTQAKIAPDLLVLLSGPEPQRTILENIVLKDLEQHSKLKTVLLRGLPGDEAEFNTLPDLTAYNHLNDEELVRLVKSSKVIICRPGYSTIMDLFVLGRSAVLVPTPGQTEQEYLARYLSAKGFFFRISQDDFNISSTVNAAKQLPESIDLKNDMALLENRVRGLYSKLKNL